MMVELDDDISLDSETISSRKYDTIQCRNAIFILVLKLNEKM